MRCQRLRIWQWQSLPGCTQKPLIRRLLILPVTEYVYLSGKCKWCKTTAPNQFGDWKTDLYPDDKSLTKIMELKARGLKNTLKKDEDGPFIAFKRPMTKMMKGRAVNFTNPVVLNKDGVPINEAIGNGSEVTLKLLIYPFMSPGGAKGIGARWESVRVDNLVPWELKDFAEPAEREAIFGLKEAPKGDYNF